MKINFRKINKKEELQHFKDIEVNGYTVIRNLIPRTVIKEYLVLTKEIFERQRKNKKIPPIWNKSKYIYNLQSKSIKFLHTLSSSFLEKMLIKKLNDPHFRNLEKNKPNYILNNFIARSSADHDLFFHIDSGIPTGDVTTFMQLMIPLEKTEKLNGCTVFVPKSHKSKKFADRKTKNYQPIEGDQGDVFIWDGNLWHGSLPNKTKDTRWALIATFSNWQFKQCFDIPKSIGQKIYSKLTVKEKILLGYLAIPSNSEFKRVTRSMPVKDLKKKVSDY